MITAAAAAFWVLIAVVNGMHYQPLVGSFPTLEACEASRARVVTVMADDENGGNWLSACTRVELAPQLQGEKS